MADGPDQLALLTEAELRASLAILGTPESARRVAAAVSSIPAEEREFFVWKRSVVLAASCLPNGLAARIAGSFGNTPAARAEMEQMQRDYHEWVEGPRFRRGAAELRQDDVVFDVRTGRSLTPSRRNQLALFTEAELRGGLEICGTPESAREVAARVYAIPPEEQDFFEWTDSAVMFVSCVSPVLAERVAEFFGSTPELRTGVEEQQRAFREQVLAPGYVRGRTPLDIADVVCDSRDDAMMDWDAGRPAA